MKNVKLVLVIIFSSINFLSIACQSNNHQITNDEVSSNPWTMNTNEPNFYVAESFANNTPFQKTIDSNKTFKINKNEKKARKK